MIFSPRTPGSGLCPVSRYRICISLCDHWSWSDIPHQGFTTSRNKEGSIVQCPQWASVQSVFMLSIFCTFLLNIISISSMLQLALKYRVFSVLGDVESIFRLTNKHVDEQSCAVLPFPDLSLIFPKSTRWLLLVGCFIKIYFPASR